MSAGSRGPEYVIVADIMSGSVPLEHLPGMALETDAAASLADRRLLLIQRPVDKRELSERDRHAETAGAAANDGDLETASAGVVVDSHDAELTASLTAFVDG
jgi:hypothetical protein